MKNKLVSYLVPVLLLATSAWADGEPKKEITIRRRVDGPGGPGGTFNARVDRDGPPGTQEMEKVAFLGVETMPVDPTVAAQLSLPRETGLAVRRVADGSPAASLLQKHDILTKLDDQILVDMHQLSVLVRNHKAGDEVKLTYVRGGKESSVKAKLGEHEVPKLAMDDGRPMMEFFNANGPMGAGNFVFRSGGPGLPGMENHEAGDVMRLIGGDRMNWFARPRVHIVKRQGGKAILDLPNGNFVFSDDEGSVEVNATEGKRDLTVKNKKGEVTFQGPINTPEDHKKLPPEVMARLEAIGGADIGDDDDNDLEIETKIMQPATKTRRILPPAGVPEAGMRSL
ncbi:MAG TPA: PDZ domain-containing protein [Lacunisphaera sp.]|nr:PDZ domain-containing protein [Lacunisphaera sp.]